MNAGKHGMKAWWLSLQLVLAAAFLAGCGEERRGGGPADAAASQPTELPEGLETATLGGGCFWCVEAIYRRVEGVHSVVSGFAGGEVSNPTYRQVMQGTTGHAEVVRIHFDSNLLTFDDLLEIFFATHDPTTLNRQGADVGPQYRSIILAESEHQRERAEHYRDRLNAAGVWADPIVTEIAPFTAFYPAEDDHQDYFAKNPDQRYCALVIAPKVEKFEEVFRDRLKPGFQGGRAVDR